VLCPRLVVPILVLALGLASAAAAPAASLPTVTTTATLSVLVPPVDHVPAGTAVRRPAKDGMNLGEGDRVVTGHGGTALITFLDGSTVTVEPGSDVGVRHADAGGRDGASIRLLIHAGKVWARIASLLGRRSSISLESSEYAATAHDGLIGAERRHDGGFVCWTRAGELALARVDGTPLARVAPGHRATVVGTGTAAAVEPFSVHASTLRVTASPGVRPLLLMPDGRRAAGFVAPGVEVNQVFGSLTSAAGDASVVEVPAGVRGPYTLVLEGAADGPFTVSITGQFRGDTVVRRELRGTIARDGRLVTRIEPYLDDENNDPRAARLFHLRTAALSAWTAPLPAHVLLSPLEATPRPLTR
jgi:hypothetical protein